MQLHKLTQILLLAGFISLLFLPALGGGYLLDDENNFVSNSNVQLEFELLTKLFSSSSRYPPPNAGKNNNEIKPASNKIWVSLCNCIYSLRQFMTIKNPAKAGFF